MIVRRIVWCVVAAVALTACSQDSGSLPTEFSASFSKAVGEKQNFSAAPMSGDQEVPARTTPASGQAKFKLSKDGRSIEYHLSVEDITNVHMAHIHRNVAGLNGPIVVWLYPSTTAGALNPDHLGSYDGRIASGVIRPENVLGDPTMTLDQRWHLLLNDMRAGNTYVNVHTVVPGTPPHSGPGNFPGGEIRGQIRALGPKD
jgi:hypothetical protein